MASRTSVALTPDASASQINLAWTDNSSNEDAFKVERSANGTSGWAPVASLVAGAVSWQDTGLTAATTYCYRVYATNASGASDFSNVASATTSNGTTPTGVDSDGDGYSDEDEKKLGTNPLDPNSKPGGAADFDGDGIPDDLDPDADGDGVSNADELRDGTNPYDPQSVMKRPMTVLRLQCSARFDVSGKDWASISGTIPDLPPLFSPAGKTLMLIIGGADATFRLDARGRARASGRMITLNLKMKWNRQTKKQEFQGGAAPFMASVRNVSWAGEWLASGFDPARNASKAPQNMAVDLRLDGKVYTYMVTGTYWAKAGRTGRLKK